MIRKPKLTDTFARNWLNPHPLKGMVTPLKIFPCRLKTKKETDLSHLGNLKYIICCHFDDKKIGGTPSDDR